MLMTFDADGVVCLLSLAGLWDGLCLLSASGYSTVVFVTPLVWAVGETLSTFLFFLQNLHSHTCDVFHSTCGGYQL